MRFTAGEFRKFRRCDDERDREPSDVSFRRGASVGFAAAFGVVAVCATAYGAAAGRNRPASDNVHQARRAHPSEVLSVLPSARLRGPDVTADVRRRAALGAFDQAEGHDAGDAALVHRQERLASRRSRTIDR